MKGAIAKAKELEQEIENAVILGQFVNTANPRAHEKTTGPEIWKDIVMELRRGAGKLRYSPYQLFKQSDDYENIIQEFILRWEKEINS